MKLDKLNCERYAIVDFGKGPVEIRCTETGPHKQCRCVVVILPEMAQNKRRDPRGR